MKYFDKFKLLKTLSSETKAKIITLFIHCDCDVYAVNDLSVGFNLKQSNTSKHLSNLTSDGILNSRKVGKETFYRINSKFKETYGRLIETLFPRKVFMSENKYFSLKCVCS